MNHRMSSSCKRIDLWSALTPVFWRRRTGPLHDDMCGDGREVMRLEEGAWHAAAAPPGPPRTAGATHTYVHWERKIGHLMGMKDAFEAASSVIEAAYLLHDSLYQCGPEERQRLMSEGRDRALAAVETCVRAAEAEGEAVMSPEVQSRLLYLRGKATACSEDGRLSDEAERLLADAVKLNPTIIDAWNCLGECFWQRGEYETAKHTFLGALDFERTAATLCHLSMLLRTMSGAAGMNEQLLLESAVAL